MSLGATDREVLRKLFESNEFQSPGQFFCTLYENRRRLSDLESRVPQSVEIINEAKEIQGILENLDPIAKFAEKIGLTWKVMEEESEDLLSKTGYRDVGEAIIALSQKEMVSVGDENSFLANALHLDMLKQIIRFDAQIEFLASYQLDSERRAIDSDDDSVSDSDRILEMKSNLSFMMERFQASSIGECRVIAKAKTEAFDRAKLANDADVIHALEADICILDSIEELYDRVRQFEGFSTGFRSTLDSIKKSSDQPSTDVSTAFSSYVTSPKVGTPVHIGNYVDAIDGSHSMDGLDELTVSSAVLDIEKLKTAQKSWMDKVGVYDIAQCERNLDEARTTLKGLQDRNRGEIPEAVSAAEEIVCYEEIISLEVKIQRIVKEQALASADVESSLCAVTQSQIDSMLFAEGLDDIEECIKTIVAKEAELAKLTMKGLGANNKKIIELTSELNRLKAIINLAEQLGSSTDKKVKDLESEIQTLLGDAGLDTIDACFPKMVEYQTTLDTMDCKTIRARTLSVKLSTLKFIVSKDNEILGLTGHNSTFNTNQLSPNVSILPNDAEVAAFTFQNEQALRTAADKEYFAEMEMQKELLATTPECAEKTIWKLVLLVKEEVRRSVGLPNTAVTDTTQFYDDYQKFYDELKQQLIAEELSDATVNSYIRQINDAIIERAPTLTKLQGKTKRLWSYLQPLDVGMLLMRLEGSLEAAQRIRGKDVVLLLGCTGAGKTATVHWLGRSKMKEIMVPGCINPHFLPVDVLLEELREFISSPYPRSETRCIRNIEIPLPDGGTIIICDAPGFGDTKGVEVDISNGMGVVKALRLCNSVKPLVLVSKLSGGDRMEEILGKLGHVLIMMLPKLDEHFHAFSYGFTKFSKNEQNGIHDALHLLYKQEATEDKSSVEGLALLKDMVNKTEKGAFAIDPVNDTPDLFLQMLAASSAIVNPADVFEYFVSPESLRKLKDQLNMHKTFIRASLRRMDTVMLKFKMDQLLLMAKSLEFIECSTVYGNCVKEFIDRISELKTTAHERLDSLQSDTNADVSLCFDSFRKLCQLEPIRAAHCPNEPNLEELCSNSVMKAVETLVWFVQDSSSAQPSPTVSLEGPLQMIGKSTPLEVVEMKLKKIKSFADNAMILCNNASENELDVFIQNSFTEACQYVAGDAAQSLEIGLSAVKEKNWRIVVNELDKLKSMELHLGSFIGQETLSSYSQSLSTSFVGTWNSMVVESIELTQQESLKEDDITNIEIILSQLNAVSAIEGVSRYSEPKHILDGRNKILDACYLYVNRTCKSITTVCSKVPIEYPAVLILIDRIEAIRKIPDVEHSISVLYQKVTGHIRNKIIQAKEDLISLIAQLSSENFDSENFITKLMELHSAKCLVDHKSGVQNKEFGQVKSEMKFLLESVKDTVQHDISLVDIEKLKRRHLSIVAISQLSSCFSFLPEIGQIYREICDLFLTTIKNLLLEASKCFTLCESDFSTMRSALILLRTIKLLNISGSKEDIHCLEEHIEAFINKLFASFQQIWEVQSAFFYGGTVHPADTYAKAADHMSIVWKDLRNLTTYYAIIFPSEAELTTVRGEVKDFLKILFQDKPNEILNDWKVVLSEWATKFNSLILPSTSVDDLGHYLDICLALKREDFISQPTFGELAVKFEAAIASVKNNAITKILLAVQTGRYRDFVTAKKAFEPSNPDDETEVGKIIIQLNSSFASNIASLDTDSKSLNVEDVHRVSEFVKTLTRVRSDFVIVKEYLSDGTLESRLGEIESVFFSMLNSILDKIEKMLDLRNFVKCETVISTCSEIESILTLVFSPLDSASANKVALYSSNIDSKKLYSRQYLVKLIKEVGTQPLSEYGLNPPLDLYDKLMSIDNEAFCESASTFSSFIVATILEKLEDPSNKFLADQISCIKEIEDCLKYLPPKIIGLFDGQFQSFKVKATQAQERLHKESTDCQEKGDFKNLADQIISYIAIGDFLIAEVKQAALMKMMLSTSSRLEEELSRGNLQSVLETFSPIWTVWYSYSVSLPKWLYTGRIPTRFMNIQDNTDSKHRNLNMKIKIRETLNKMCSEMENAESWRVYDRHISHLLYFMEFKEIQLASGDGKCLYYAIMGEKGGILLEKIKSAIMAPVKWMMHNTEEYRKKIPAGNVTELRALLDIVLASHSVYQKISEFIPRQCSKDINGLAGAFSACQSHKDMKVDLVHLISTYAATINEPFLDNPATNNENESERNNFYAQQFASFNHFKRLRQLCAQVTTDPSVGAKSEETIVEKFKGKLKAIHKFVCLKIDKIPISEKPIYRQIKIWNDNFRAFSDNFNDPILKPVATGFQEDVRTRMNDRIVSAMNELNVESNVDSIIHVLLKVKPIAIAVPVFRNEIDDHINRFLSAVKNEKGGIEKIGLMGVKLNEDITNKEISQLLINDHPVFEGYALSLRNEKTAKCRAEDVVKNVRVNGNKTLERLNESLQNELLLLYKEFDEEYWDLVSSGLSSCTASEEKQKMIVNDAIDITAVLNKGDRTSTIRRLLSHIFAWWTLSQAKHYIDALNTTTSKEPCEPNEPTSVADPYRKYLVQPHAAQVISIFRLLGLDTSPNQNAVTGMSNHLIQVSTGEGKSVILSVTATVLAMMGYEVYCACYSQYLSERDYKSFLYLFKAFAVDTHVHYSTFNNLCETYINKNGDVRALVETAINNKPMSEVRVKNSERGKMLLIDEVDVFFNKDFYGNLYRPLAKLSDPSITKLINYVWSQRSNLSAIRFDVIKNHETFREVLHRFPEWSDLMHECLKSLLSDLRGFDSQDYVVRDNRIGYKDQDSISFEAFYGYKTLFVYYKENAAKKVVNSSLQSKIGFYIDCGNFSYAEVPKEYIHVMGVSGTLESLSEPKKNLLSSLYSIRKATYIPSVYGANQLQFNPSLYGVMIEPYSSYFNTIYNEIKERLKSVINPNAEEMRAVLVFFESKTKLKEFYESDQFRYYKERAHSMTEEVSAANKEGLIRQAVTHGSVTLLTKDFGRGTDFICYDENLLGAGGVHVIQTFVSDEVSEETQIKGRTARQGNKGSYSMVLLDETLEKYGITEQVIKEIKKSRDIYGAIDARRNDYYKRQYPKETSFVNDIKKDHDKSTEFLKSLVDERIDRVKDFLLETNRSKFSIDACKTMVLIDATGSMTSMLEETKRKVKNMFTNAYKVLKDHDLEKSVQMQFVVYRNYNVPSAQLLQYSGWTSKPDELRTFIDSIKPAGGMGNEAIEIAFWHVNNEITKGIASDAPVSQVILIGDYPPNLESEVDTKRTKINNEVYWSSTVFKKPTHYKPELKKIRDSHVPVHAFYIGEKASVVFTEIANETGGDSAELIMNEANEETEKTLTTLITTTVLNQVVGGGTLGKKLVDDYKKEFCRGYVSEEKK